MRRIQLNAAERYPFASGIQIYISHINQGGHLDNAQLLTLVSEARLCLTLSAKPEHFKPDQSG
jgi:acyl-CoA thioesterase FadM